MTRAVLDPGVIIAALISPGGAPASILRRWRDGELDLVVCPMLLEELDRALTYPKVRSRISEPDAEDVLAMLQANATVVADPEVMTPISRDPGDDYLFALAREHADVLVSGDAEVTSVPDPEVRVMRPGPFARLMSHLGSRG